MEKKLVEALEQNYQDIVGLYSERLSSGHPKLDIRDVAKLHLCGLKGVMTDMNFQQFISDALGDPNFRFSPDCAASVKKLVRTMKDAGYSDKNALVRLLKEKLPLEVAPTSAINKNTKFQMLAVKEATEKNPDLKRKLEEESLKYAMEHSPEHLFGMLASLKIDSEHLEDLGSSCLRKHYAK